MSESGHTWRLVFKGHPAEAARVRQWTRGRLTHRDAPAIANELFVAILGSSPARRPNAVEITISTAGRRARISASGAHPLPMLQVHGPGVLIIDRLSQSYGATADGYGVWARLVQELT
ncbi:hypothetical protein ACIBBB_24575 [Streptomyces sp. NPDC051217]|uniref:hypothetical protein n=1 Tax=Streptomyces sp. NPDC051217 TaxID=3365644 RepID=UPI00378954FA